MAEKGKLTEDAKRGDLWAINPYDGIVVGHDDGYPPDVENDCYDENRLRKLLDEAAIERLADSIEAVGENIEPVVLKKKKVGTGKSAAEYLAVNAGRRRTIACRRVFDRLKARGIDFKMKVILADRYEESVQTFMRTAAENANREDNSPTQKARDFARLVKFSGDAMERISKETMAKARAAFGVNDSTLANWLMLLRAAPKVQQLVDVNALPQNVVRELVDLPSDEQEAKALEYAKKAQEDGKGANLLAIARFEKGVRQGTKSEDEEGLGLTRGECLGIWKLMQEDKADGKDVKIEAEPQAMLEAIIGKRKIESVKGLVGYYKRLKEQKKERAEKKAQKGSAKNAAAAE